MSLTLEEVKFLQKQREKKSGIPALPPSSGSTTNTTATAGGGSARKPDMGAGETDVDKDELVLQDTFAQETAVLEEDPNMYVPLLLLCPFTCLPIHCSLKSMSSSLAGNFVINLLILMCVYIVPNIITRLKYVEQELAKKRGKNIDVENQAENEVQRAEDELYKIPEHLKVSHSFFFLFLLLSVCFPSDIICATIFSLHSYFPIISLHHYDYVARFLYFWDTLPCMMRSLHPVFAFSSIHITLVGEIIVEIA